MEKWIYSHYAFFIKIDDAQSQSKKVSETLSNTDKYVSEETTKHQVYQHSTTHAIHPAIHHGFAESIHEWIHRLQMVSKHIFLRMIEKQN